MRLSRQLLGASVFRSTLINSALRQREGIESGAFWFYRKLGFRPVRTELAKLVAAEERKLAARAGYRTPPHLLRRLASGHVLFETHEAAATRRGEWDRFQVRNIGLAVARRMAKEFDGDADRMRAASVAKVKRALGAGSVKFNEAEERAFSNFALVLALSDLARWTAEGKRTPRHPCEASRASSLFAPAAVFRLAGRAKSSSSERRKWKEEVFGLG